VSVEVNDASHWREFEKNPLSHSMAHYLMAIDALRDELGYARSTDVADKLDVSRGAASMALSQLKKRGWVSEDPNRFLLLTEEGKRITHMVEHNFLILSTFFSDILYVGRDKAFGDACKMEHLMSRETGRKLLWLLDGILNDSALRKKLEKHMSAYDPKWDSEEIIGKLSEMQTEKEKSGK